MHQTNSNTHIVHGCTLLDHMECDFVKLGEVTISTVLWHRTGSMTEHYSVAQARELLDALNLITVESNRTNVNLQMLFREKDEFLS